MPWFKVDDQLHSHPKWVGASAAAKALWVTAGSWSAAQLTDGHVPRHVLPVVGGKPRTAEELVELGLWEHNGNGWVFHDWHQMQPSRVDVEAARAEKADAGARGNHQRWHAKKGITNPDCVYCQGGS